MLRRADKQTVAAINLRCEEGCDCRSRRLERQRFDANFKETRLMEAATDGHRANQRTADTELPGVEMGTPSAGRAPKKLRLLRIKTESIRSHPLRDLLNSQLQNSAIHQMKVAP